MFDAGPTVITAPFLFEELFALFDKRLEDYVDLRPVEPWYRFLFPDGRTFDYGGTIEDTLREIERFEPRDREGYRRQWELAHVRGLPTVRDMGEAYRKIYGELLGTSV